MNIAPLGGVVSSAAGASLAQAKGSEIDRTQHDATAQQRQTQAAERADQAAGIAAADGESHETNERDADGRRAWEDAARGSTSTQAAATAPAAEPAPSRDATGERGQQLDLSG